MAQRQLAPRQKLGPASTTNARFRAACRLRWRRRHRQPDRPSGRPSLPNQIGRGCPLNPADGQTAIATRQGGRPPDNSVSRISIKTCLAFLPISISTWHVRHGCPSPGKMLAKQNKSVLPRLFPSRRYIHRLMYERKTATQHHRMWLKGKLVPAMQKPPALPCRRYHWTLPQIGADRKKRRIISDGIL